MKKGIIEIIIVAFFMLMGITSEGWRIAVIEKNLKLVEENETLRKAIEEITDYEEWMKNAR